MADAQSLTLAFLASHSVEAARVVDALPAAEAAALFNEIPARVSAPVLAAMLPPAAARVLGLLDDEHTLAVLAAAGTQAAVAMLRHIAEPGRTRLITGLPTVSAMASRVLLGFPEDSVGAWTDPEVIALTANAHVSDALARLRQGQQADLDQVFVVDAERRLQGCISLQALLRAAENTSLSTLTRSAPTTLSAMMPVAAAARLPAWERVTALPVAERDERLIGVLRRSALSRAVGDRTRAQATNSDASVAGVLAASYWTIVSGLASASLALLPRTKRVLPEDQ
jgi:magnesium transporter